MTTFPSRAAPLGPTLEAPAALATALAAEGHGTLVIARSGDGSYVRSAMARSPLRLLMPANHGHAAWVYASSFGGGILDGDAILLSARVEAGASAFVTSQGSTKIYRSPRGCRQAIEAEVGAGALLAWVPDPVVCFAGAAFEQRISVRLDEGASLVLVDGLQAGRTAHGERWAFRRYHGRIDLYEARGDAGRRTVGDSLLLDGAHGPIERRMGGFEAMATLLLSGPRLDEARAQILADIEASPLVRRPELIESASVVGGQTLLVRVAARRAEVALDAVRRRLAFLPSLLGDDPFARKW